MRDVATLRKAAAGTARRSASTPPGCSTPAALDQDAHRLPAARPGPPLRTGPVEAACSRALELDVVDVGKIARMLEQATENTPTRTAGELAARASPLRPRPRRVRPGTNSGTNSGTTAATAAAGQKESR